MNRRDGGRRRRRAQRTYRLLVRLYPAAHRRAFGDEMVQAFGDHYRDAVECRGAGRLRFWLAVLTDAGTSLLTEYAAELRAQRGKARTQRREIRAWRGEARTQRREARARRLRRPAPRTEDGKLGEARKKPVRVARRLHYHRHTSRRSRVLIRARHHRLVYRGRIAALIVLAVLISVALGTGTLTGHLGIGAILAGVAVTAWLAYSLRLARAVLAGPRGNGPAPPGGASVREPRRPLPMSPSGSNARPRPDQDEPGQAVALI